MPGSMRTIDATSQRYDPIEEPPSSPEQTFAVDRRKKDLLSQKFPPSPEDSDNGIGMREASPEGSPSATTREERRITRNIDWGTPGDQAISSESKTPQQRELARKKSQYYEDAFATREPSGSARERVTKESLIYADVRTNVIIEDEYTFIMDLSYILSSRYQRPETSIIVTLSHSICMLFGGNFDPAYSLTITALRSQLQPVTNKRNAALLAKALQESLGVSPERGLIKFTPIEEENMATDSRTVTGMIEDLEKVMSEGSGLQQRTLSMKSKRRHSIKSLRGMKTASQLPTHNEILSPTPPMSERDTPPLPPVPTEKSALDKKAEKVQKMGRRKSFIASIFGRN